MYSGDKSGGSDHGSKTLKNQVDACIDHRLPTHDNVNIAHCFQRTIQSSPVTLDGAPAVLHAREAMSASKDYSTVVCRGGPNWKSNDLSNRLSTPQYGKACQK